MEQTGARATKTALFRHRRPRSCPRPPTSGRVTILYLLQDDPQEVEKPITPPQLPSETDWEPLRHALRRRCGVAAVLCDTMGKGSSATKAYSHGGGAGVDVPLGVGVGGDAPLGGGGGGVLAALAGLTALRRLSLRLIDALDGGSDAGSDSGVAAAAHGGSLSLSLSAGAAALASAVGGARCAWACLPVGLESLSLHGVSGGLLEPADLAAMAAAAPRLRHLRLLHCHAGPALLWQVGRPSGEGGWRATLEVLVVKEAAALAGVGSSGVVAVAALTRLRTLGLSLEPLADVAPLAALSPTLRYLLLDGRSNAELRGVRALRALTGLRALVLPLLHLHSANRAALVALKQALPGAHIANVSRNLGLHHGAQWFRAFGPAERRWWADPELPWAWFPTLAVCP